MATVEKSCHTWLENTILGQLKVEEHQAKCRALLRKFFYHRWLWPQGGGGQPFSFARGHLGTATKDKQQRDPRASMILRGGNRLQKVKSQKLPLLNTFSYTIYVVSEKLRNPISFKLSCFSLKKSSQNRCPARNGSAVLSRIAWMWWQPALLAAVLVTSRLFSWTAAPPPALASLASSFFLFLLRSPMLNSET